MKRVLWLYLFILTGCASPTPVPVSGDDAMPVVRFLALGDSYTIGESVDESERWPIQLASLIESFGEQTEDELIEVTIIARTGWTTSELWEGIQAREINPPYDLVSLLIGVNNQYRGYDINKYREEFTFLLNKAIEYTGGDVNRVIVLSIPDWGVTPFARGRNEQQIAIEIDQFNAVNRKETEKAGAHYIDITPISREAVNDPSLIAGDGLHPSGKMYSEWVQLALPVVLEILDEEIQR